MTTLDRTLRKKLEKTVKQARNEAETGAKKVLEELAVNHQDPYQSLTDHQRKLRDRLRAHAQQLGDQLDPQHETHSIDRLIQECAYQHWHRMLFTRFLAETDLLIEPESDLPITLDDCKDLADHHGTDWLTLASDYAERMLPQIFRHDAPVLALDLPPESRSKLEELLKALPRDVFTAGDGLGWVYQFWQADSKNAINEAQTKIGPDELPAVTQLFTENYMVSFLLHNTIGAWWAGKVLAKDPELAINANDEDTLRHACKVGDVEWSHLRFVRGEANDGTAAPWRPAAGTFGEWPCVAKDITMLDPCMGSGHFLVFALPLLVAIRMTEEGLSQEESVDAVLRENLFGLELDQRCTQIAAFNLVFTAWRLVGYRKLPTLNLACSGLSIGVSKERWVELAHNAVASANPDVQRELAAGQNTLLVDGLETHVKNGLETLYDLFAKAPWLGSLIAPRDAGPDLFQEDFGKLEPFLEHILSATDTDEVREIATAAQGMAKAGDLMTRQFTFVATNVPFLGRRKQDYVLQEYCKERYDDSKLDLATCFLTRSLRYCVKGGSVTLVMPQSWIFLKCYRNFRNNLLTGSKFNIISPLGKKAFETITGEVVNVVLTILTNESPDDKSHFVGIDTNRYGDALSKSEALKSEEFLTVDQNGQKANADSTIMLQKGSNFPILGTSATSWQGLVTRDIARFVFRFWEVPTIGGAWEPIISSPSNSGDYTGRDRIVRWDSSNGALHNDRKAHNFPPQSVLGCKGILLSQHGTPRATLYTGEIFCDGSVPIIPRDIDDLGSIYAFLRDDSYALEVKKVNQNLNIGCGYFVKVPYDQLRWKKEFERLYPDGLPNPNSTDARQWLYSGLSRESDEPLSVAVSRLLGYEWPRQTGSSFMACAACGPDGLEKHSDSDGIVCLTATKGEAPADHRLNALLAAAFGKEWSAARLAEFLARVKCTGKSLDDWLRDHCFEQHCELFADRPFIWHIWDGRRDGFHALVNYHRLVGPNGEGKRTLEKLIYTYLGDWRERQVADQKAQIEGADARLAHAEHLRAELIKILNGEPPYDIFVRWKPLHQQAIGWEPDIDDGVRMNIRPFMTARPFGARSKNACILRSTPNINWKCDRGKDSERDRQDYPWFWGWDQSAQDFITGGDKYHGDRWNNLHYSRGVKTAARERHALEAKDNT